ncbi:hypothetical protein EcWSU1_01096 [Enterobacter ludwigii]|uniref:Uncharacterized protein n=1 Tax=Enterobacter ludwigii TaxID=299767 RepID=G8LDE9_9ENTR|nr:hypothetical protein EcWSU1_01096 [Enterobacter ludwigii]
MKTLILTLWSRAARWPATKDDLTCEYDPVLLWEING